VQDGARMSERRSILEDRVIEYEGLAIAGIGAAAAWMISSSAQRFDAGVIVAGAVVGASVNGAWILGYPRRAAIPAMALAILIAMIALPMIFDMDGALLREATDTPASRVYVAMGLYIGGLGVVFLALIVFGFIGPLVGAYLGLKRGEKRARETLTLHCALTGAAIALIFLPRVWL